LAGDLANVFHNPRVVNFEARLKAPDANNLAGNTKRNPKPGKAEVAVNVFASVEYSPQGLIVALALNRARHTKREAGITLA
jgi:hypothetical protein